MKLREINKFLPSTFIYESILIKNYLNANIMVMIFYIFMKYEKHSDKVPINYANVYNSRFYYFH